jgi:hypothetical protein
MERAFVVQGRAGRWAEDSKHWIVAVFLTEEKANTFRDMCEQRAAELMASRGVTDLEEVTDFDPFFCCMDGVVRYKVTPAPFMETSNEANMAQWFVLQANKEAVPAGPVLTEQQQALARAAFLASLPVAKSSKDKRAH